MTETTHMLTTMGKRPVFVFPTPRMKGNVGERLVTMTLLGVAQETCGFSVADYAVRSAELQSFLNRLTQIIPVTNLMDHMCSDGVCDTKVGDVFMYRDGGHLSVEGSALLGKQMDLSHLIKSHADAFYGAPDG